MMWMAWLACVGRQAPRQADRQPVAFSVQAELPLVEHAQAVPLERLLWAGPAYQSGDPAVTEWSGGVERSRALLERGVLAPAVVEVRPTGVWVSGQLAVAMVGGVADNGGNAALSPELYDVLLEHSDRSRSLFHESALPRVGGAPEGLSLEELAHSMDWSTPQPPPVPVLLVVDGRVSTASVEWVLYNLVQARFEEFWLLVDVRGPAAGPAAAPPGYDPCEPQAQLLELAVEWTGEPPERIVLPGSVAVYASGALPWGEVVTAADQAMDASSPGWVLLGSAGPARAVQVNPADARDYAVGAQVPAVRLDLQRPSLALMECWEEGPA